MDKNVFMIQNHGKEVNKKIEQPARPKHSLPPSMPSDPASSGGETHCSASLSLLEKCKGKQPSRRMEGASVIKGGQTLL